MTDAAPVYSLSASLGYGRTNHIIDGVVRPDRTFVTLCGRWGAINVFPWTAGQSRRDSGRWCKRCVQIEKRALFAERSPDGRAPQPDPPLVSESKEN